MNEEITEEKKKELGALFLSAVSDGLNKKRWTHVQIGDAKAYLCPQTLLGVAILIYDDEARAEAYVVMLPVEKYETSLRVPRELALDALHLVRAQFNSEDDPRRIPGRPPIGTGYTHVLRVGPATHRMTYVEGLGVCHVRLCDDVVEGSLHALSPAGVNVLSDAEAASSIGLYPPNALGGAETAAGKIAQALVVICANTAWFQRTSHNATHMYATNEGLTLVLTKIEEGEVTAYTALAYTTGVPAPVSFGVDHPTVLSAWKAAEESKKDITSFGEQLVEAIRTASMVKTFDNGYTKVEADLKHLGKLYLKYERAGGVEKCEGYLEHPTNKDAPMFKIPAYLSLAFYKGLHGAKMVRRDGELVAE